jgi:predicted O-linked N-acetylglucosamine transferase (SPINDLY family)
MRVLRAVDGSVLWLKGRPDRVKDRMRQEAEAQGVDGNRLVFAVPVSGRAEHLARLQLMDLMLDSSPYSEDMASAEALWSGVPVLTAPGRSFPSRIAGSTLCAAGLPELIADSLPAYEMLARDLALHPDRLTAFKNRLVQDRMTAPLFDLRRYVSHLEAAYRHIADGLGTGEHR